MTEIEIPIKIENPITEYVPNRKLPAQFRYCIFAFIIALYAKIWKILHPVSNRNIVIIR